MVAGRIVVGVDGSESSAQAVRWAAQEAARRGAGLRLVHTFEVASLYGDAAVATLLDDVEAGLEKEADEILTEARGIAEQTAGGVVVETRFERSAPGPALIEESRDARLVVIGSKGRGALGSALGSVTLAVASHAACPIVVVRGTVRGEGPVVVGVDGGPASDVALEHGFAEASFDGAPLVAVHVWSDADTAHTHLQNLLGSGPWASMRENEDRALAERLAGWSDRYPDVVVEQRVEQAEPAAALVAHSANARLVVVATRGRGGFTGLLLGSTGLALIQHAEAPVMLVGPRSTVTE